MTDPLKEATIDGLTAAHILLSDAATSRQVDEMIEAIRAAALNDTKTNYEMLRGICAFAAIGFEIAQAEAAANDHERARST